MPAGYLLESDRFILRLLNQYPSHVLLANYTALNCNHDSHHLKQTLFFYQTPCNACFTIPQNSLRSCYSS